MTARRSKIRHESRTFDDGGGDTVSAVIARPVGPAAAETAVTLAHGSGADMTNPFLVAVADGLAERGYATVRFNFRYTEHGRRAPERAPALEACYRSIVEQVRATLHPRRLVIGGKSLGGRIASRIVAFGVHVDGLLFLGYPLHPPGKRDRLRVEHLVGIRVPMLFFAGTRDPLCDLDRLHYNVGLLTAPAKVHIIPDGDHSFNVLKRTGRSAEEVREEIIEVSDRWMQGMSR
jgi:predicted alpha/beta-hydrolase family hydrolase